MGKDKKKLMQAVDLLGIMSHPVRLSILCNLHHMGEMNVTDIVKAENGLASQSQVSQFLASMREHGLVSTRRAGKTVFYRIACKEADAVISALYGVYCGKN